MPATEATGDLPRRRGTARKPRFGKRRFADNSFVYTRQEARPDGEVSRPKHKLSRREGVNLTGTTSPSLQRRPGVPPGQARPRQRQSEYAIRLRAVQRVKRQYGMLERDFRRSFAQASKRPGDTGENSLVLSEHRLDPIVYRL